MSQIVSTEPTLDQKSIEKYVLSLQRGIAIRNNFVPDPEQEKMLKEKQFNGKILILGAGWCGDCSQVIPVIYKFFGSSIPVKILYREQHPMLMQQFLTNGTDSIPIVIFMNSQYKLLCHWGPRTRHGNHLLQRFKSNPENYPRETFLQDLHAYYDENQGFDIIAEILSIL
ncbi:thioredoxin family protein [Sphingobacterium kitahiroshimense]|uniref:Thioredoxin family protein n=1 Tax=Sphingobacterium kitahiroshimense TaxID=470446 RepID=A0ABV0BZU2_9SPHI